MVKAKCLVIPGIPESDSVTIEPFAPDSQPSFSGAPLVFSLFTQTLPVCHILLNSTQW